MTFEHNPRRMWTPPLLELGVLPWHMELFSPGELTELAEWQKQVERAAKRRGAAGGVG